MSNLSRRDFLKFSTNALLALAAALGLGELIVYLSYPFDPPPPSEFDIGPVTKYPTNSHTVLAQIPAILIHDTKRFQAISLTCSHLGCTVKQQNLGFECPCHGSRYDTQGKVLKGPATKDLSELRVEETEDGNLHLFTN